MKAIAPERHGLSAHQLPKTTLEDLQVTAAQVLQGLDVHDRLSACGRIRVPHADPAAYGDTAEQGQYMTGVCRCENAWACPVCAFSRQLETRLELAEAMNAAVAEGHWVYMLTLTIPHTLRDGLDELNEVLADAWAYLKSCAEWKNEWADRIGYAGCCRTYEVTHGREHGWHPHIHGLLFCEDRVPRETLDAFERWAFRTMARRIRSWYRTDDGELRRWPMNRHVPDSWGSFRSAFRPLHPSHGVSLEGAQNAATYLSKLGLSREVTGLFGKTGRAQGNRTMFQVLLDVHLGDDPADHRIFREYVEACTGRSKWHWTPGFRDELLPKDEDEDMTDDELLEEEAERLNDRALCFRLDAELWDELKKHVRYNLPALLLEVYNGARGTQEDRLRALGHFIVSQFPNGPDQCVQVRRERGSLTFRAEFHGAWDKEIAA